MGVEIKMNKTFICNNHIRGCPHEIKCDDDVSASNSNALLVTGDTVINGVGTKLKVIEMYGLIRRGDTISIKDANKFNFKKIND